MQIGETVFWKGANRVESGQILELTDRTAYVSTRDEKGVICHLSSIKANKDQVE